MPNELKPSDFAKIGQPCCSIWCKSEIEWIALAYVLALANDGDVWKPLTRAECYKLLTDEQRRRAHGVLLYDFPAYREWFDMVAEQLCDAAGALAVRGYWARATSHNQESVQ